MAPGSMKAFALLSILLLSESLAFQAPGGFLVGSKLALKGNLGVCRRSAHRAPFSLKMCAESASTIENKVEETKAVEEVKIEEKKDNKPQNLGGATPPEWHLDKPQKSRPNIPVAFEDISTAAHRIRGAVKYTKCEHNPELSEITGTNLFFKHEYKQFTGSFKERGARNALLNLPEAQKKIGVIAASAGNHALGLAYHSKLLGIPVTVVMPETAPITKIFKCRKLGANVVLHGSHIGEAKDHAMSDPQFAGLQYINGYDDPAIIAGAGTIGLEILEQNPDVDAIVVPVGGAGLIAGISLAVKSVRPEVEVIGVEPERCASYTEALKYGSPTAVPVSPTLADGLAVPTVGPHAFEVAKHFVDRTVCVNEKMVALAVLRLVEHEKAVVEGGGAAGLAALLPGGPLYGDSRLKGKTVVVPLCGGNIDTSVLGRVIERGLAADRRLVKFESIITDRPGGLAKLTALIASTGAGIWDITHERAWLHESVDQVVNCVTVELTGKDHEERLKKTLKDAGYYCKWYEGDADAETPHIPPGFIGYRAAAAPEPQSSKRSGGNKPWKK